MSPAGATRGELVRILRGTWKGMYARVVKRTGVSVKVVFDDREKPRNGRWYAWSEVEALHTESVRDLPRVGEAA